MKNRINILVLVLSLLMIANLYAGQNGGYAGAYLRTGLGARSIALGNATMADTPNAFSFYYNPAASGFLSDKMAALSYSFLSLERQFNYIGFAMEVPPGAGFSIGWLNAGDDPFSAYNSIGDESGTINHSINAVYFNFARKFGKSFSIGLNVKYMWEFINDGTDEFDYVAKGLGWDLGVMYRFNKQFTFALAVRDIGSKLKANTTNIFEHGGTTTDYFPNLYDVGVHYQTPFKWLEVHYKFEASEKLVYRHHIGIEGRYLLDKDEANGKNLALRMGVNSDKFVAGAGMGFTLFTIVSHLDYAFTPSVIDEGSSHIFSWQFFF